MSDDPVLIVLGGVKSETYTHWPDLQNKTGPPETVDFIGQYFDVDKNRWMPLVKGLNVTVSSTPLVTPRLLVQGSPTKFQPFIRLSS